MSERMRTSLLCVLFGALVAGDTSPQTTVACGSGRRQVVVKISHDGSEPMGTAEVVIPSLSLSQCSSLCAKNLDGLGGEFPCAGFDYSEPRLSCMLSSSLPAAQLAKENNDIGISAFPDLAFLADRAASVRHRDEETQALADNILSGNSSSRAQSPYPQSGFYWKLCIMSMPGVYVPSNASFAFEQFPNRVLPGSTDELVKASDLASCLAACLEARQLRTFTCRSLMYAYETADCLLNSVDRRTAVVALSEDTDGLRVDYFENHLAAFNSNDAFPSDAESFDNSQNTTESLDGLFPTFPTPEPLNFKLSPLNVMLLKPTLYPLKPTDEPTVYNLAPVNGTNGMREEDSNPSLLSLLEAIASNTSPEHIAPGSEFESIFTTDALNEMSSSVSLPESISNSIITNRLLEKHPSLPNVSELISTANAVKRDRPSEPDSITLLEPIFEDEFAPLELWTPSVPPEQDEQDMSPSDLETYNAGWAELEALFADAGIRLAMARHLFILGLEKESTSPLIRRLRQKMAEQMSSEDQKKEKEVIWMARPRAEKRRKAVKGFPDSLTKLLNELAGDGLIELNAECGHGTVPQYVEVRGKDMELEHDFTILGVSQRTCEHFCTINRGEHGEEFSCEAYAYDGESQDCFLMDEMAGPRGAGRLEDSPTRRLYEKVCLAAENSCLESPAFEKQTSLILPNFAQVILEETRSLERCLTECLQSAKSYGFECLSAVYFYQRAECVLNSDSRLRGENNVLMEPSDPEHGRVDYFDNVCMLRHKEEGRPMSACPDGLDTSFVEYKRTEQVDYSSAVYSAISLEECLLECHGSGNFTCQSADYRSKDRTCSLSFVGARTARLLDVPDTNHYERICIEGSLSACQGLGVSFSAWRGMVLHAHSFITIAGVSLPECLSLCLLDPSRLCESVNYVERNSSCSLCDVGGSPEELREDEEAAFFRSHCTAANSASPVLSQGDQAQSFLGETALQRTSEIELITDCTYSGMRVRAVGAGRYTGSIFAKNHFQGCRTDVVDQEEGILNLPFPSTGPVQGNGGYGNPGQGQAGSVCGVVSEAVNVYSATVVVATNNLGIPGLVTAEDLIFQVRCDYSDSQSSKVTATGPNLVVDNSPQIPVLYPDGQIQIPAPLEISLKDNGRKVANAALGDNLELAFDYYRNYDGSMGTFVRQCNASKGFSLRPSYAQPVYGGYRNQRLPQEPQPLVLIEDGYG